MRSRPEANSQTKRALGLRDYGLDAAGHLQRIDCAAAVGGGRCRRGSAGQFAENPPTGNRLIPLLLGGAAIYGHTAPAAAKVAGAGLTVRAPFQTEAGRGMLLYAGKLRPGTPEMERLSETIVRMLAATSAGARASGAPPADPTAAPGQ